ncbi:MAG: translation initiation factor IF-3, partial [Acidimicrobiia bacterium]|nr:translation initiation factor IF-3 [Acidimicrobiia bacterium]
FERSIAMLRFLLPRTKNHENIGRAQIADLRINGNIRAKEVLVIAPDGSQIGTKKIEEAVWLADQLGLDLVEVAPEARPPVCKIMDYGKHKYEQSVRDREARKKQTRTVIKEIRLKPRIGDHDYEMFLNRSLKFLSEGDKLKVTVRFRGRENERPELGLNLIGRLVGDLGDYVTMEQHPSKEGRSMTAVLAPTSLAKTIVTHHKSDPIEEPSDPEDSEDAIPEEIDDTESE